MKVNLSELEEKYGPFETYGGPEIFIRFVNEYIPEECRKDDIEFNIELFKKAFIRCKGGYLDLSDDEVVDQVITDKRDKIEKVAIRYGDYASIFWRFVRPEEILQIEIEEAMDTPSEFYGWLSFLFTKYKIWDGKYSLNEVIEYYSHKECARSHMTIEEILKMMDKNLRKRYFSIEECLEKNLDRINPRRIVEMFDDDDLEEIFYDNLGDKDDLIYGDNGTVLTFKK